MTNKQTRANKVRSIVSSLNYTAGSPSYERNGEAWGKVRGNEIIRANLPVRWIKAENVSSSAFKLIWH